MVAFYWTLRVGDGILEAFNEKKKNFFFSGALSSLSSCISTSTQLNILEAWNYSRLLVNCSPIRQKKKEHLEPDPILLDSSHGLEPRWPPGYPLLLKITWKLSCGRIQSLPSRDGTRSVQMEPVHTQKRSDHCLEKSWKSVSTKEVEKNHKKARKVAYSFFACIEIIVVPIHVDLLWEQKELIKAYDQMKAGEGIVIRSATSVNELWHCSPQFLLSITQWNDDNTQKVYQSWVRGVCASRSKV